MSRKCFAFLGVAALLPLAGCGMHSQAYNYIPPGPTYAPPAPPGVLMAGTNLVVRTDANINTNRAVPGETYPAEIADAVLDAQGQTVIPAGSPAELMVVDAHAGGAAGTPELTLALRSISVDGVRYNVVSDVAAREASRPGLGGNERTARFVGSGALLGTLLGAVAGGGTGAALGAVGGAVGGGALQVFTKGRSVRVPAETLLTFQLDSPIRLEGYQRR